MATSYDFRSGNKFIYGLNIVNCYGGFVPNYRRTVLYQDSMDIVDNPHYNQELKGRPNKSVTQRSYPPFLSYNHGKMKIIKIIILMGKKFLEKVFKFVEILVMNLSEGPRYYNKNEAMDRFCSPVPEGRRRHANMHRTVNIFKLVPGFTLSLKIHNCRSNKMNDSSDGPLDALTKYNPWPRHLLGYRGMLDKSFRPQEI